MLVEPPGKGDDEKMKELESASHVTSLSRLLDYDNPALSNEFLDSTGRSRDGSDGGFRAMARNQIRTLTDRRNRTVGYICKA